MILVCRLARPFVVGAAADGDVLPGLLARHHHSCLRCQAVTARTRATVRELRSLSLDVPVAEVTSGGIRSRVLGSVAAGAVVTAALVFFGRRRLDPA